MRKCKVLAVRISVSECLRNQAFRMLKTLYEFIYWLLAQLSSSASFFLSSAMLFLDNLQLCLPHC
jgi:hypothetical protein